MSLRRRAPGRPVLPPGVELIRPLDQTHGRSVWLARDNHLDRLLTVKRLTGSERELRSVALLSDVDARSLARVYGVHQHRETHWLLSEFIDGVSLASGEMIWPAQAVLPLLIDLTSALVAMADAGVVHCDISPGNVLIDVNGRVRLVDFGIAARAGEAVSGAGTPGFAAPEVVAARCCTSAADLWSLAAIGCWLLTLEAPYWVTTDDGQHTLILPAWRPADEAARSLWSALQRVLLLDPASRPGVIAWREALISLERLLLTGDRSALRLQAQRLSDQAASQSSRSRQSRSAG